MNNALIKQIEADKHPIQLKIKKVRRMAKKTSRAGYFKLLLLLLGISALYALILYLGAWFNKYKIVSPVIKCIPFCIEKRDDKMRSPIILTPPPKPTKAPQKETKFDKVFDTVWLHESGRGTNKTGLNGLCISKGMINEIGYAPGEGYCFKNREDQKDTFVLWFQNRLAHKKYPACDSIDECLSYYNSNGYKLADK